MSKPVPGGGGRVLGVVTDNGLWKDPIPAGADYFIEVATQWYTEPDYTQHSLLDIPVGATVNAEQIDVDFHINGVHHVLQMGPQPVGHCFSAGTTILGLGTTRGRISRPTTDQWIVDLPRGSIGRLFEDSRADQYAVDKGLYYVSLHYVIKK